MIQHLDATIQKLLQDKAEAGSKLKAAQISFDLPDADWRAAHEELTVNCYLYDIRENHELRTHEPIVQRNGNTEAARRRAPVRIDCAYCITAWSAMSGGTVPEGAVREEHELLGDVLKVLLKHPTIPEGCIPKDPPFAIPPYPTVIAAPDGVKNQPEFWGALDQQLKPSLNYVVTLALMLDERMDVAVVGEDEEAREVLPQQPPAVKSVVPSEVTRGQGALLQITGLGTHFRKDSRVRFDPADGITMNTPVVQNVESLRVSIGITESATPGWRKVIVTTGSEIAEKEKGFVVKNSESNQGR